MHFRSFKLVNLVTNNNTSKSLMRRKWRDGNIPRHEFFHLRNPLLSIRLDVFTVSPNRQYLGILEPTTPATTDPECIPMRSFNCSFGLCLMVKFLTLCNSAN